MAYSCSKMGLCVVAVTLLIFSLSTREIQASLTSQGSGESRSDIKDMTVCTKQFVHLDCGQQRIHILDVYSGRSQNPHAKCHMTPGDEMYNNSFAALDLWRYCNMRPNCQIYLRDGNYYTYVFLKYQCIQEIPAIDICSNLTSRPTRNGFLFSPGYPLIIPKEHPPRCSCRVTSNKLVTLKMLILHEEFRCMDQQRFTVYVKNDTMKSSYICATFNRYPLYIYNETDIVFEFKNDYYAAGGKFWILFQADQNLSLECGEGSPNPVTMSQMANVSRVVVPQNEPEPTHDNKKGTTPHPEIEVRILHQVHKAPVKKPQHFGLVNGILITSTVLLAVTITLYVCWQHHTRGKKSVAAHVEYTNISARVKT